MNKTERDLRDALLEIRERVDTAIAVGDMSDDGQDEEPVEGVSEVGCIIKTLPSRLLVTAARTAVTINPMNAPAVGAHRSLDLGTNVDEALRMAVSTSKYWGRSPRRLTVSFMETTPADLRKRIVDHMNAWTRTGGISFVATGGTGQIRISRGSGGYYSYLGTDVLHIPRNRQTMNLEGFTMSTPESEYKRVVRHETGHTLGAPHEHMRRALVARIDPQKAYDYFWRTQGWNRATVDAQVLTPLDERTLLSTPPDQDSIMCYQLPGSITRDGRPIRGGRDINASDYAFIHRIYPNGRSHGLDGDDEMAESDFADEWAEAEDVAEAAV